MGGSILPHGGVHISSRRSVLLLAGATFVAPRLTFAQQPARKVRIAVLHTTPLSGNPYHRALKERLAAHGFVEGKNLVIDAPVLNLGYGTVRAQLAKELVQRPDAILTFTTRVTEAALAGGALGPPGVRLDCGSGELWDSEDPRPAGR